MGSKNVDAPRRSDSKSRSKKSDAADISKSGPNRHPKLSTKKSAKSTDPGPMRGSGVQRTSSIPRTGMHGGKH